MHNRPHKSQHRQVAPGVVMPVEQRQLLLAMRGIVGGVQIEGDAPHRSMQGPRVPLQHAVGQRFAHPVQFLAIHGVFKPRQRRLRSQIPSLDGIASQQQFVNRIARQTVRIIGIRIAAGNAVHPLPQQLGELMINLASLPLIPQTGGHAFRQPIAPVRRLQQNGASVGTALPLVKLDHDRLGKKIGEQQTLCCGMFSQAKASGSASNIVFTACL